jgi:hypothetical protein
MDSIKLIEALLTRHKGIASIDVFEPNPIKRSQDRVKYEPAIRAVFDKGVHLRSSFGFPFWDSVLVSCLNEEHDCSSLLAQATFHNSPPRRFSRLHVLHWREQLHEFCAEGPPGSSVVLSSRVELHSGKKQHIPMVDLHIPAGDSNLKLATAVGALFHTQGGYLLDSGQSYHFYGKRLLEESELASFLGRALLLAPLTDRAWIAHQMIEGACGLRIFGGHPINLVQELSE